MSDQNLKLFFFVLEGFNIVEQEALIMRQLKDVKNE